MIRATRVIRSAVAAEGPRMTIAKNVLMFQELKAAGNEGALDAAMKATHTVDVANLPPAIAHMKDYLAAAGSTGASGFAKDPAAWQNMSFGEMAAEEVKRNETWPFIVGIAATWLMMGVGIPAALPAEGKKTSKYISMIEGRHGKIEGEHH